MNVQTFEELRPHVGHELSCVMRTDPAARIDDAVSIECVTCEETLLTFDIEEDCVEWTVWVLNIHDGQDSGRYLFEHEDVARDQLYEYVKTNWRRVFEDDDDIPKNRDAAVAEYFTDNEAESYTLVPEPVLCAPTQYD